MMGTDSVAYHEHTVVGRADDPVVAALEYYASRGETPMVWGGLAARLLDLEGEVDLEEFRAIFGPGGAIEPKTGKRLVKCLRPGLELVISPSKSVSELGVIGRAEDMHAICDAERDATLAYLEAVVMQRGGRRGRAMTATETEGLVLAITRHATSRAGDPLVHDHVLIANLVLMLDELGGWKGLDTALLRDHLHAATAIGRMAGAAKAVELGYAIVSDDGPSRLLGSWAIDGIPEEILELHSTRAAQIDFAAGTEASYAARNMLARATRDPKGQVPLTDLMARWRGEIEAAGWPADAVVRIVDERGAAYRRPVVDLDELAGQLLGPEGRLSAEKTFTRADVMVAVAPHLHGLPVSVLHDAVAAALRHPDAVPLPAITGARERVWAAACVLIDEERVAELAALLCERPGPSIGIEAAVEGISSIEREIGRSFTATQRQVAEGLLTGGQALALVVGIAGSGKTTTLSAVRAGFEDDGFTVIGTATSGQAAKNLGEGAGMESRTVASLWWRLQHGDITLTDRHVLILDESGMTPDVDIARLLGAVERVGAKMIVVGDDRQLGPVGPGGTLGALLDRHPENVWRLTDNLRQADPAEQAALADLRSGEVGSAVGWYAANDRVHALPNTRRVATAMAMAWAADVAAGREAVLLAYKRADVELLNRAVRQQMEAMGRLSGLELTAEDGRAYRAGDRIITLAPGPKGAWMTSQSATVTSVDVPGRSIRAVTPDGRTLAFGPDDIAAGKLDWGYAITAHRSQGSTVDVAHVLADGGGRELAYVAMSRARQRSDLYVVAANQAQAADRLAWSWEQERRQAWIDQVAPSRIDRLRAERQELIDSIPADITNRLAEVRDEEARARQDLVDLQSGSGRWADTEVGEALRRRDEAAAAHREAEERAADRYLGLLALRRARRAEQTTRSDLEVAARDANAVVASCERKIDTGIQRLREEAGRLSDAGEARRRFLVDNKVRERIGFIDQQIAGERARVRTVGSTTAQQPLTSNLGIPSPARLFRPRNTRASDRTLK
jgi:conjugative relaxase-like TrwC/TraI family protein